MKKIFLAIVSVIISLSFVSCSKERVLESDLSVYDASSAQSVFAEVLSKAVHENQSLRFFIQSTALEQYDCDYDVFYPFVKDKEVEPGKTFRDILLEYCNENTLTSIEKVLPKLNILVPDWSWVGCFSVNSWDASNRDVAVSYVSPSGDIDFYDNGEYVGSLPDGVFPDFPVLIIKSNERMSYTPSTRGTDIQYDFVDEAFKNTGTRVQHQYYEVEVDGEPDVSNFVPRTEINYRVKQAYNYFSGSRSLYQRDYLYYGMTEEGQTKPLVDNVWETLYKFKFTSFSISALFDDRVKSTFYDFNRDKMLNHKENYKKNNSPRSESELRKAFYAEGNLDLTFLINVPIKGGSAYTQEKCVSVSFGDVFAIKYVNLDYRHRTWFVKDWYVYTLESTAIKPKWCIVNLELVKWDISTDACIVTFVVTEFDENGNSEITYSTKRTVTNNFKVDGEVSGTVKKTNWKVGLGYNNTSTNETATQEKYSRGQGGVDHLGKAELEYLHPILMNKTNKGGVSGYEVHTISTGSVDLMILPKCY